MIPRRPAITLPEIVDCRAEYGGTTQFPDVRAGECDWCNPHAWRIEYRSTYENDAQDSGLKGRAMGGNTEREALIRLQKLEAGFGAVQIELYHISPPLTADQIEVLAAANRRLANLKFTNGDLR